MKRLMLFSLLLLHPSLSHAMRAFLGVGLGEMRENSNVFSGTLKQGSIGLESRHFGGSFSLLYFMQSNKLNDLTQGSITLMPLMFNGYFRGKILNDLGWHGGGGFSYVLIDHDRLPTNLDLLSAKVREQINDGIGFQTMGGLEYRMTKNIYVLADVFYLFFHTEDHVTTTLPDRYGIPTEIASDNQVELNSLFYTFSVKYKF